MRTWITDNQASSRYLRKRKLQNRHITHKNTIVILQKIADIHILRQLLQPNSVAEEDLQVYIFDVNYYNQTLGEYVNNGST